MNQKQSTARIHVLFAKENATALIIRRGPSKQVAIYSWDRKTNKISLGQWLKGRIYERRCDLSPDGRYFIYFAFNGKWASESKGSWTGISRAPYLKALAFFPKGDAWHGGGLWTGNKSYWLNSGFGHEAARNTKEVVQDHKSRFSFKYGNSECLGVYYPRLLRDGWEFLERQKIKLQLPNPYPIHDPAYNPEYLYDDFEHQDLFEKPYKQDWTLLKIAHSGVAHPTGKGCYWDEHVLIHKKTTQEIRLPHAEWAETDKGNLYFAEAGKLFSGTIDQKNNGIIREEIYDFNSVCFEPIKAPY